MLTSRPEIPLGLLLRTPEAQDTIDACEAFRVELMVCGVFRFDRP